MISVDIMMNHDDGNDGDDDDNNEDAGHEVDIDEDKSLSNLDQGRSSHNTKPCNTKPNNT